LGSDLVTREAAVARLAVRLGRGTDAGSLLAARRRRKHVHAHDGAARSVDGADPPDQPTLGFDWTVADEPCRLAWLRGRFLARGSLSLVGGRTHLEFVVPAAEAPVLAARLGEIGLPAAWRVRRGRGVVVWKSAETVSLFLRRVGGGAAVLELEARQVSRALRGDLNRVINAESANLQRSVEAAGRQLAAIGMLRDAGRLAELPDQVRLVAAAREETPEASLGELAERLGLHRSAVQRALDRIERTALLEVAVGNEPHVAAQPWDRVLVPSRDRTLVEPRRSDGTPGSRAALA
jgi:DNA-binding transcriptional regulator WhiA